MSGNGPIAVEVADDTRPHSASSTPHSTPIHRTTSQKYKDTFSFVTFHSKVNLRRKLRSKSSAYANFIDLQSDFNGSELSSYPGPRWDASSGMPPDQAWIDEVQNFFVVHKGRLARKYVYKILVMAEKAYRSLGTLLVDLALPETARLNISGDIHGQLYDLIKIFKLQGPPSAVNYYLFNGDIVDKGENSIECLLLLLLYKLAYPQWVFINRGNHESALVNVRHGFQKELVQKYPQDMFLFEFIGELFRWMPVAHLVNRKIFVIHGGLPDMPDLILEDIRRKK